jgi:Putative Ig domain
MSGPIVTGCSLPVFGTETCAGQPVIFESEEITSTCPVDYSGGPFTSVVGKFQSVISQADADAQATAYVNNLLSKCVPMPPVVSNGTIYVAPSGAVSFQIVATQAPSSYGATGLPAGLSLNTTTGLITGNVPALSTTYSIPISATNNAGTGNGTLILKVRYPLTLNFAVQGGFNGRIFEIAVDGGAYSTLTTGINYTPNFQLKFRTTLTAPYTGSGFTQLGGTITVTGGSPGPLILAAGSKISNSGTVGVVGSQVYNQIFSGGPTVNADGSTNANHLTVATGLFSYTTDISGTDISLYSLARHDYNSNSPSSASMTAGVMETILNF